ncbi:MAG: hypothetical protein AB3N13_05880 [Arenibacterium sp.]
MFKVIAIGLVFLAGSFGSSQAGTVLLDQSDLEKTRWPGIMAASNLKPPAANPREPAVKSAKGDAATLLNSLVARGQSQGFGGILYENRDRGHSSFNQDQYPNLTFVRYGPVLRRANVDYGVALSILINRPLIGNSSTALTSGYQARSLTRLAMTVTNGASAAFLQFASNSLYIYPEHHDHDALDMYPANWLYTLNSQGSSGSDRRFVQAMLMTLAAFPKQTRAFLEQHSLLVPTLQMIMRRNLSGVNSQADYMSAKAHPMAFDNERLRMGRMVSQAASLNRADVAPLVHLDMLEEDFSDQGGLAGRNEQFFTTPGAIARIWRGLQWEREFVVSAEKTTDPNGRELKFFWTTLQGDGQKITIEPLNETGSRARITMRWHDLYTVPPLASDGGKPRQTSRVDIGVFAYNGAMLSAPSFVSVAFPTHQKRQYGTLPDGSVQLLSIDYNAKKREARYDPITFWSAAWTDSFDYDDAGALEGWTRKTSKATYAFQGDGRLADGRKVVYEPLEIVNRAPDLQFRILDE